MKRTTDRHHETGSAMIISLLTLLLLSMLGTLFMAQSNIETQISGHDMRATQALYAAEAGYAEGLARMSDAGDSTNYVGRPLNDWQTNPGWGTYIVMSSGNSVDDPDLTDTYSDGLDNDLDGQVDEEGETYPEVLSLQGDDAIEYPWVKIEYKLNATNQVIVFGDHDNDASTPPIQNLTTGVPVLRVTASGETGTSGRTVEIEAIKAPVTTYHAAMYVEDDDFTFDGMQWTVSGEDHDPVDGSIVPGGTAVPGIATTEDPNVIEAALGGHQTNNVPGEGGSPSITDAVVDMDLAALMSMYANDADIVVPGGHYLDEDWGDLDNYHIVHVTGDLTVTSFQMGGGVLLVDGDLSVAGHFLWYGLVICMGDVTFSGGGQGIHILGATMVQGGFTTQTVKGNADIFYSSAALAKLADLNPYVVTGWHEL